MKNVTFKIMSNTASTNEAVECYCWQLLGLTSTGNSVHEEVNNNHINIETRETTTNNTVIFSGSTNSYLNESTCDEAIETTSELETYQKIADKTVNMAKESNNLNKFPFGSNVKSIKFGNVQRNSDDVFKIDDLNIRSNGNKGSKGTNKNIKENKPTQLQSFTVLDAQQVNESIPPNDSPLDCSQIDKLLNHSERNKALIKSVLTSNKNAHSKVPVDKSTLKQILDVMKRESQDVEAAEVTNADIFTQTENVVLKNKQTQAEFSNTYCRNCTIHMDMSCVNTKDFMHESKMYYEEYQQRMESLFMRHSREWREREENKDQKHTISNNNQVSLCNERVNGLSTGNNSKVDNNVSNHGPAVDSSQLATNTNNSRGVNATSNSIHTSNPVNNHTGTDTNNNDKVLNAVNPMPRHGSTSGLEKAPVVQTSRQWGGNQSNLVRAGRPRNDVPNQRFVPYPRQQTWQQMEYNARQRPTTHMPNCPNGAHFQHNWMNRPFNSWQTPNSNNPQAYFTPHHHHHHQF